MAVTREGFDDREHLFRTLFESSPDAIFIEDIEGYVLDCNPAAVRLHCTSREKLVGKHVSSLVPVERRSQVVLYEDRSPTEFEGLSLTEAGQTIPVSVRHTRIEYLGKPATLLHVREIVEQKRLEEELRRYSGELELRVHARTADLEHANEVLRQEIIERTRAEEERRRLEEEIRAAHKMEAVGRLAGGVAHDFNNLLTVIIGRCELLLDKSAPGDSSRSDLLLIYDTALKAASVTRQLLAFGRKQVLQLKALDLNSIIRNMEALLRSLITEDIEFILDLSGDRCGVEADSGQIEQVVTNLVVNALDAMPAGGILKIETQRIDGASLAESSAVRDGAGYYIVLSVHDSGCGMDSETLSHIFEPFFTTKDQAKGTGLGLSTVYGIIQQSGGWVVASSKQGAGTTFRIYLPEVELRATDVRETSASVSTGTETILLVEDSDVVRQLTREMLEIRGYTVIEACNGEEALRICSNLETHIQLALSDVVMPRLNGLDFAEQVSHIRPDLKVLLMSGYAQQILDTGVLTGSVCFIAKPFSARELAAKVREVLDQR